MIRTSKMVVPAFAPIALYQPERTVLAPAQFSGRRRFHTPNLEEAVRTGGDAPGLVDPSLRNRPVLQDWLRPMKPSPGHALLLGLTLHSTKGLGFWRFDRAHSIERRTRTAFPVPPVPYCFPLSSASRSTVFPSTIKVEMRRAFQMFAVGSPSTTRISARLPGAICPSSFQPSCSA
jgi:hypothetical protein